MPMKKNFDEFYTGILEQEEILPNEWRSLYEVTTCLKESAGKGTYLVRSKADKSKYILKTAREDKAEYLLREGDILKELQGEWDAESDNEEGGAAIYVKDILSVNGTVYLMKNYVAGISLARKAEKYSYSDAETAAVGIDLCREVRKLHHRKPPVIHRDIKPENIIIKPDGSLALIDLETARTYKAGQREDTRFMGTRETAAPEQYGFGQSDVRTDIYGIGRTLLYVKMGGDFADDLKKLPGDRKINRIIRKCCSFDPDRRYADVDRLINSLSKCLPCEKRYRNITRILCTVTAILFVISAGLSWQLFSMRSDSLYTVSAQGSSAEDDSVKSGDYQGKIVIDGWDVTDYDRLTEEILASCDSNDYDRLAAQCEQLLTMLYADGKVMSADAVDVYGYTEDDSRWEEYNHTRMGYEMTADKLAYHDGMLKREMGNLYACRYQICMAIRNISEYTEADADGNLRHTLLYEYAREDSEGKKEIDYSITCVLDGIITGVTLYHEENG